MPGKKIIWAVAMTAVLAIALYLYKRAGGFQEPTIDMVDAETKYLSGEMYEGSIKSKDFGVLFERVEQMANQKGIDAPPAAYYYNVPSEKNDYQVKAFVGGLVTDSTIQLGPGFQILKIEERLIVKGVHDAHMFFMRRLYEKMEEFARNKGMQLDSVNVLEIYPSTSKVIIENPVLEEKD